MQSSEDAAKQSCPFLLRRKSVRMQVLVRADTTKSSQGSTSLPQGGNQDDAICPQGDIRCHSWGDNISTSYLDRDALGCPSADWKTKTVNLTVKFIMGGRSLQVGMDSQVPSEAYLCTYWCRAEDRRINYTACSQVPIVIQHLTIELTWHFSSRCRGGLMLDLVGEMARVLDSYEGGSVKPRADRARIVGHEVYWFGIIVHNHHLVVKRSRRAPVCASK